MGVRLSNAMSCLINFKYSSQQTVTFGESARPIVMTILSICHHQGLNSTGPLYTRHRGLQLRE